MTRKNDKWNNKRKVTLYEIVYGKKFSPWLDDLALPLIRKKFSELLSNTLQKTEPLPMPPSGLLLYYHYETPEKGLLLLKKNRYVPLDSKT